MKNNLVTINNVRGYIGDNNIAYLNLEDVVRGLGFEKTEIKNGKKYKSIRWSRINDYLCSEGFDQKWSKDNFIPENAFYSLCMIADSQIAKKFRRLVCDEILPSIRRNGGYIVTHEEDTDEEIMARALLVAQKTIEKKNQRIQALENKVEEDKPKVELADLLLEEDKYFDFERASKMINIKGLGRNTLFKKFRESGYLDSYNKPYQRYVDAGYFKVVPTTKKYPDGNIICKTLMSGKVIEKIIKKFRKSIDI